MPLREELGASVAKSIDVLAVAHWLYFVLAVLERFPINGQYWAAYLCQMFCDDREVSDPCCSLWSGKRQEIVQVMGVRDSEIQHLTPAALSVCVWISPCKFLCLLCTLPSLNPLGPKAPTCKGRTGISCPPAELKLSPGHWCKSLHISLSSPRFSYLPNSTSPLCPLSHPLIPAWVRVDSKLAHSGRI